MKIIDAAGGVLFRKEKDKVFVLLIKRNGTWDLPKGKVEANESIEQCARREVAEEVGIPVPQIVSYLCKTYHEYVEGGEKIGKNTWWYSMRENRISDFTPQQQEGITEVEWAEAGAAVKKVGYKNLEKVLAVFIADQRK